MHTPSLHQCFHHPMKTGRALQASMESTHSESRHEMDCTLSAQLNSPCRLTTAALLDHPPSMRPVSATTLPRLRKKHALCRNMHKQSFPDARIAQQALRVLLGLGCCLRPRRYLVKVLGRCIADCFGQATTKTSALWSTSCVLSKVK
jgi:hypothetical protein